MAADLQRRTEASGRVLDSAVEASFLQVAEVSTTAVARWMCGEGEDVAREVGQGASRIFGELAARCDAPLNEATKRCLRWRDAAETVLQAQARQFAIPEDAMAEARRMLARSLDVTLVRMCESFERERQKMSDEALRQSTTSQALLELSMSLADIAGADEMAARVARAVPALVDCDRAAVFLSRVEAEREMAGELRFAAAYGYPDHALAAADPTALSVLCAACPSADGLVWGLGDPAGIGSAVAAPIIAGGGTIGWVMAGVAGGPERLSANSELAGRLRGVAAQAATAISNARLVDQIRYQSMHDPLTGLPNRALILDRLERMLSRARRNQLPVGVLFVDLDGFKGVNDTSGHGVGDQLLTAVADRLAAAMRDSDTVGRLGGDEFVVLIEDATFDAGPELVAERLLDVLREPFAVAGAQTAPITLTASVGIATGIRDSAADLLRDADIALYEAKSVGKDAFMVFAPEMQTVLQDHHLLELDLRRALADDQFFLVYQPIFDLRSGATTGVEALLRWSHPRRGVVPPGTFIGLLEDNGMIIDVGRWALGQACRQGARWHGLGYLLDVSVNVSARQLDSPLFVEHLEEALRTSGFPAGSLIIEITETALMRNVDAVIPRLESLKDSGVRIAIDDFGTGYSSLAYLRQLPVDTIKIDQSFVAAMAETPEAGSLIRTLVQLGKTLGLTTLAEGIELDSQRRRLKAEECDNGQGYLYARPLAADRVVEFLTGPLAAMAASS